MKKRRSMRTQMNYAVTKSTRIGQSRHSDMSNPNIDSTAGVYSIKSADILRDTIDNFCRFMKEAHHEITYVRVIISDKIFVTYYLPICMEFA